MFLSEKGDLNYQALFHFLRRQKIGIYFQDRKMRDMRILKDIGSNIVEELDKNKYHRFIESEIIEKWPNVPLSKFYEDKKYMNDAFVSKLQRYDVQKFRDSEHLIHLFFENFVIRISKDKVETINWSNFDTKGTKIWKSNISDKPLDLKLAKDYRKGDWFKFAKNTITDKGVEKLMQSQGYLVHTYKKSSKAKMVIYADANDDDDNYSAEGGTGKSLHSYEAIKRLRKTSFIEGTKFEDPKKNKFVWQTVDPFADIVCLDDVEATFKYRWLYNAITNYFSIERKQRDPVQLPFKQSPKFVVTTNHGIMDSGGSDIRRRVVLGFQDYYSKDYTPEDDFGREFFDDWDVKQWSYFFGYFIDACQLYLQNGVESFNNEGIDKKAVRTYIGEDLFDWIQDNITNLRNMRKANDLLDEIPVHLRGKTTKDTKRWLVKGLSAHGYKLVSKNTRLNSIPGRYVWAVPKNSELQEPTGQDDGLLEDDTLPF